MHKFGFQSFTETLLSPLFSKLSNMLQTEDLDLLHQHWMPLQGLDIPSLVETSGYLHRAAQFISMLGKHYLPHEDDDSQTNMDWNDNFALVGKTIDSQRPFFMALNPRLFELQLVHVRLEEGIEKIPFAHRTKAQVRADFEELLRREGLDTAKFHMNLHYEIPDHPTDNDRPFQPKTPENLRAMTSFADLRGNAHRIVEAFAEKFEDYSPTATWPHHFDVGSMLVLGKNQEGGLPKTIGIGMAPKDAQVSEPYFYVNPWQDMETFKKEAFDALSAGRWIVGEEWTGAVLPLSELLKEEKELERTVEFFEEALKQSTKVLDV